MSKAKRPAARSPSALFQPQAAYALQRGMRQVVAAVCPTLGPQHGHIAVARAFASDAPELLDDAGTIARRIVELPGRGVNTGAMLARHLLWRVREQAGDGAATAAVLLGAVFDRSLAYVVAGGDAMRLRRALEHGAQLIRAALAGMARPVSGRTQLASLAESLCYEPRLAALLGEIFDIIGEHGRLEIRAGQGRELEREYVEGLYWDGGLLARELADEPTQRAELADAAIALTDLAIDEPRELAPLLEHALAQGRSGLLLTARSISDRALGLLALNRAQLRVLPVQLPGQGAHEQAAALHDLALLTGARPLLHAAGARLRECVPADLGRARRAWANHEYAGITGGQGDPRALRRHVGALRDAHRATSDADARAALSRRLGRLSGGTATLWVGGATKSDIEARTAQAARTGAALRAALAGGALPGGGAALLACRAALAPLAEGALGEEGLVAQRILRAALAEPMRVLAANAGHEPAPIVAAAERAGASAGFDARTGAVGDIAAAGVLDIAAAQQAAAFNAITTAALALTIDVLIHPSRPATQVDRP